MPKRINNFVLALLVFAAAAAQAQDASVKVMVLFDMEGMSGATEYGYTSSAHKSQYAEGRKMMTADVNAAIRGLLAGGATEIVVVDGHGSGYNDGPDVNVEDLLPPAQMVFPGTPFDIYMDSYDASFDAIVAIGMHAAAGNRVGFLAHTYTAEDVEYTVNGVPYNESMILAAGAARLKIPLVMVSGDDQLGKEIARHMPWVRYATVKHAVNIGAAVALPPDESARRIESAARTTLRNLDEARLPDWPGPYRFYLRYQDVQQAQTAALVPGAELAGKGVGIQFVANDFEEGYRRSIRSISLASGVGRRTALEATIRAQPNADALLLERRDRWYRRWLETHGGISE